MYLFSARSGELLGLGQLPAVGSKS